MALSSLGYDPKLNYQALINAEKAKGTSANQSQLSAWNTQREAKIAGANQTQRDAWGVTYKPTASLGYDSKTDYQALINTELAKGNQGSQADINTWTKARQLKISDASPAQYNQWGITAQNELGKSNTLTPTLRQYIEGGGSSGDKKYSLSNIGSTPTINGIPVDPSALGMKLVNGQWGGTNQQYEQLLSPFNTAATAQTVDTQSQSKYTPTVDNQLQNLINFKPFEYNPATDQSYQQYMGQVTKDIGTGVSQEMNKRGILSSSLTADKMQQATAAEAARALPQFRQQALGEYNTNYQVYADKLASAQGLDEMSWGRNQTVREFNWQKDSQLWTQKMQEADFDYTKQRDVISSMQFEKQNDLAQKQYLVEFDKTMWDRNPDNPTIKAQILQNAFSMIDLSKYPEQKQVEIATMYSQLEKINTEITGGKINNSTAIVNLDNLQKQINAELAKTYSSTEVDKASVAQAKAKTTTSTLDKADAEKAIKNFATSASGKIDKTKAAQQSFKLLTQGVDPAYIYQIAVTYDFVNEFNALGG